MHDDDEIIEAYESEMGPEPMPPPERRGSNRGFWIVAGAILAASAVLVVEIFANRPIANTIGHAQHDLRMAQAEALSVLAETGSFEAADAETLGTARLDGGALRVVGPDDDSSGLGEVSVYADVTTWAAAVRAGADACFQLKLVVGRDTPLYGVSSACTGRAALGAADSRW